MLIAAALALLLVSLDSLPHATSSQSQSYPQLTVVGSGIFSLTPDAMGITFYIHLENKLSDQVDVATRMWECCESYHEGEVDCSHIHLIGGYKGVILPGDSRNVTLFYPNLYVYNRVGECLVGVWFRDMRGNINKLRTKIGFDTSLSPRHIAPAIAAYYEESTKVKNCAYIDEDPLNMCKPVDCSRKYNGQRVFYSTVKRRCLPAPKCNATIQTNAQGNMGIPTNVYSPGGNTCEDLVQIIKEDDIRTLNSGRGLNQGLLPSNEFDFIDCHNGNKSQYTGRCKCHFGWISTTHHIRPTSLKVHLCAISSFVQEPKLEFARDIRAYLLFLYAIHNPNSIKASYVIFGTTAALSVFLSIVFAYIYKPVCTLGDECQQRSSRKTEECSTGRQRETNTYRLSKYSMPGSRRQWDSKNSYSRKSFARPDSTNRASIVRSVPRKSSVGCSTRTVPPFKIPDSKTYSMTPEEKVGYFSGFYDQSETEVTLLLSDSQVKARADQSKSTKRSATEEVSDSCLNASTVRNQNYSTKDAKEQIIMMKRKQLNEESSCNSKNLAHITYSTLPTSDSSSSISESESSL